MTRLTLYAVAIEKPFHILTWTTDTSRRKAISEIVDFTGKKWSRLKSLGYRTVKIEGTVTK